MEAAPMTAAFSQSMAFLSRRSSLPLRHLPENTTRFSSQITCCSIDKTPSHSLANSPTSLLSPAIAAPQKLRAFPSELQGDVEPLAEKMEKKKKRSLVGLLLEIIRPYAVIGTVIGFTSVAARTWMENPQLVSLSDRTLPLKLIAAYIAVFGMDGYISSVNQISDHEIDKINKPYRPIPSGDMSLSSAWMFAFSCAINGIATAIALNSKTLLLCFFLQLALGTIYSLPPFVAKRSTYGAVLTCAGLRGFAFSFAICAATRAVLGLPLQFSPPVVFLASFSTLISGVIGAIKDIPDVEGDKMYNVPTLASIYGPRRVAHICFGFLFVTCAGAAATPFIFPEMFKGSIMFPAQVLVGLWVAYEAWKLDRANYNKEGAEDFYHFLWHLLNVEYMLMPFI